MRAKPCPRGMIFVPGRFRSCTLGSTALAVVLRGALASFIDSGGGLRLRLTLRARRTARMVSKRDGRPARASCKGFRD